MEAGEDLTAEGFGAFSLKRTGLPARGFVYLPEGTLF